MYYSLIGILALLTLVITNYDILFSRAGANASKAHKIYRRLLFSIIGYYITDVVWGVFDAFSLATLLFIDTEVYFIVMALGILFWTRYVIAYLEEKTVFKDFLFYAGTLFFVGVTGATLLNIAFPIMFRVDKSGTYTPSPARYVVLLLQIVILLFTSVHALTVSGKNKERKRYRTIGLSGLIMLIFISIQVFYPNLPVYSIAYMLGTCLLRTFVVENEKEEYRNGLETALCREEVQLKQLNAALQLAYTDALTGVKSKLAYLERTKEIDGAIAKGELGSIAVAVFDINNLKDINDKEGHKVGDRFIISACELISGTFKNSEIFRIGGDEFAAIIEGADYDNREALLSAFNGYAENIDENDRAIVSVGVADYIPGKDLCSSDIFERADKLMYERKHKIKHKTTVS